MKISPEHLSRLARLSLSDEEKGRFGGQLESILNYIDTLNELDTTHVEPTSHVISIHNVTREDVPSASLDREDALGNTPDRTDKFYRVPKILE